jgi:hypothetical protein
VSLNLTARWIGDVRPPATVSAPDDRCVEGHEPGTVERIGYPAVLVDDISDTAPHLHVQSVWIAATGSSVRFVRSVKPDAANNALPARLLAHRAFLARGSTLGARLARTSTAMVAVLIPARHGNNVVTNCTHPG